MFLVDTLKLITQHVLVTSCMTLNFDRCYSETNKNFVNYVIYLWFNAMFFICRSYMWSLWHSPGLRVNEKDTLVLWVLSFLFCS